MKRCNYCGKEYSDDATACSVDGQPLERIGPPPLPSSEPESATSSAPPSLAVQPPPPVTTQASGAPPNVDPRQYAEARRAAANRDMLVGGLWCVGGMVVTAVTYMGASGGGTYVVAWGAIIFGAIQFFRGLSAR